MDLCNKYVHNRKTNMDTQNIWKEIDFKNMLKPINFGIYVRFRGEYSYHKSKPNVGKSLSRAYGNHT